MGDFINKLQEEFIPENGDFLVFDIIDIGLGQFSSKKISFQNFSKNLSGDLISSTQSKIDNLSNSISDFQSKLFYKLDKRGLSYNSNEKMTGSLNVNSVLSCFEIAHFNKNLNSNVNKIINLSAQSFTDYDGVNKKYVDDLFSTVPVIDMSVFVLKSGDRMTGYLNLTSSVFNTNDAINKKYVDNIFVIGNQYLPISGGFMSGYLNVLNPLSSRHVASKAYVDSLRISNSDYLETSGGLLSGYLTVLNPTVSSHTSNKKYVDDLGDKYVKLTGSKVTPNFVTLNYSLTNALPNWAVTKKYVDESFDNSVLYVPISGNKIMTGNLSTYNIFSQNNEIVNKNYVDNIISQNNVKLTGDTASNTQLKRFTEKLITINHTISSNISLNTNLGNSFFINLRADCTGFTISNINLNNVYYITLSINQIYGIKYDALTNVTAIAAGYFNYSLFLRSDGTVWSVGENNEGQLGDGTTTDRSTPVQVSNWTNVTAIAAGGSHSLFLRSDGTVWSVGNNIWGQLGDGTTTNRSTPVQVSNLTNVTAIAAGGSHSLFLRSDGTVWSVGFNGYGQLGDGTTTTNRSTPVQVSNLTNVTAIAANGSHSLFLRSDGTVWSVGYNRNGQLGDGTIIDRSTPVQVSNWTNVTAIAAGVLHNLFLRSDGTVWSVGYNGYGQLGNGSTIDRSTPVEITSLSNVTAIAAGLNHSLFLRSDGTVWSVGYNRYGQLGNGSTIDRSTPVEITSLSNVTAIAAGSNHSLFLRSDDTVWSVGYNRNGQLGDGTIIDRSTPVQVSSSTKTINTVNWSINNSQILWEKGNTTIPSITRIENKVDIFTLIHKNGTWYGINAGQNR